MALDFISFVSPSSRSESIEFPCCDNRNSNPADSFLDVHAFQKRDMTIVDHHTVPQSVSCIAQ
jgi:hypothetical protein